MKNPDGSAHVRTRGSCLVLAWLAITLGCAAAPRLVVSDSGRYLIDQNSGEPFLWLGDTEWELFHVLTAEDASALMRARKAQGFSAIQVMAAGLFPEWLDENKIPRPDDLPAWIDGDPQQPNEAYLARMDRIVASAREIGMVLVIGVYHSRDVDNNRIDLENVGEWVGLLAKRYRDEPHIVWSAYPHAKDTSKPIVRAAVAALEAGDGGSHLITLHPDPSPTSSSFMHNNAWLDFNTYQTWSNLYRNFEMGRADYAREPVKPVVNGEARYETEDGTTPLQVRRGAWWSWMAGAFYSYGHGDNWASPRMWREWVDSPGVRQMGVLRRVMEAREWWRLAPDQTLLPVPGENAACRSADGDWQLVYLPEAGPVTVRLAGVTASDIVEARWLDPRDGTTQPAGQFARSESPELAPPGDWEDALLIVEPTR